MPAKVNVSKIKANLLHPALTSHFEVLIPRPSGLDDGYLNANGLPGFTRKQEKLHLLCSEATLPGSSLATHENNSDFTGVTEKFAYRRLYDDRIDFTFYVDADNYLPIRFFETWIKFIVGESQAASKDSGKLSSKDPTYFYRVKYPKDYIVDGLKITKFERTHVGNTLIYNFVNSYPIAVTSMPVSYEASSLLKCTVSFSYIRYYIESKDVPGTSDSKSRSPNGAADSPFTNPNFGEFGVDKTGIESPTTFLPGQFGTNSNIPSFTTFVPGQSRFTGAGGPAELAQINRDIG